MIIDNLKNLEKYVGGSGYVAKAMEIISSLDLENLEVGKYILEEGKLFYMIQQYDSHKWEDGKFETHNKFTDIQLVIKGEEIITFAERNSLNEKIPYNEVKDITYYDDSVRGEDFILREGDFMILEPNDGHKPGNSITDPVPVKKLVFKVISE
ncbi:MAG: YhcH/YjgK/YiaL family protein [Clostridia bacterium]|nr:YhcH/YjgK/YiaL family protein [Clostridia bacterium]